MAGVDSKEIIKAFVKATVTVLPQVVPQLKFSYGTIKEDAVEFYDPQPEEVAIVILGFLGVSKGRSLLKFDLNLAKFVAASMLMMDPSELEDLNSLAQSALGELGNMIVGNAMTTLSQQNINLDFTPPTVIVGKELNLRGFAKPPLVIPLLSDHGRLILGIAVD